MSPFHADQVGTATDELYKARAGTDSEAWRRHLIEVLKDSPSKAPKFLRWKVYERRRAPGDTPKCIQAVVEEGGLEVFPGTFL